MSNFVVLIGVSDYAKGGTLDGPKNDICALFKMYSGIFRVPTSNILVFLSDAGEGKESSCGFEAYSRPATKASILSVLRTERARLANSSMIYIHFTGHGAEASGEQVVFLAKSAADTTSVDATTMKLSDLMSLLPSRKAPSNYLAVFLDACREAKPSNEGRNTPSALSSVNAATLALTDSAGAIFLSASPGQYSYTRRGIPGAREGRTMGYFTWAVIRGLLGSAKTERSEVTYASLADYVKDEVPNSIKYELGPPITGDQQPSTIFLSPASKELAFGLPSRYSLNSSFMFYAEARVAAYDKEGKLSHGPFSYDLMLAPNSKLVSAELLILNPQRIEPPGPFRLPLPPTDGPPADSAQWKYTVRSVFMYGPNRKEFVTCALNPTIPQKRVNTHPAVPRRPPYSEILTTIDSNDLIIDIRGAWRLIGYWLQSSNDPFDPELRAEHERMVAEGC